MKLNFNLTSILLIGAVFLGLVLAYTIYSLRSGQPPINNGVDDTVNRYNAEHGMTIDGMTLTPSENGYQPQPVNTVDPAVATYVASGATVPPEYQTNPQASTPVPAVGVVNTLAPDGNGCVTGQINYYFCGQGADGTLYCTYKVTGINATTLLNMSKAEWDKNQYNIGSTIQVCQ